MTHNTGKFKRVLRVIEYYGPEEWVDQTLSRSLPEYSEVGQDRVIRTKVIDFPEVEIELREMLGWRVEDGQ